MPTTTITIAIIIRTIITTITTPIIITITIRIITATIITIKKSFLHNTLSEVNFPAPGGST